ncbi:hypothetical protein H6P81_012881 [Aristolochia fimbriata]|uniref:DUF4283 domain-containing protein n=1 Tax=Aristolochia fimbriata TaxID=158543 RepID=A0AAV7ED48_ARIFI|nr:hypothetical protein H6P81_012881 [Aristolochia fimbriata]
MTERRSDWNDGETERARLERRRGFNEKGKKPWESEDKHLVPERIKSSFFTMIDGERFYIDVIAWGPSLAVKIAIKSTTHRSFIRIPVGGLGRFLEALKTVRKDNLPGKSKETCEGKLRTGIYIEGGRQLCRITELRGSTTVGSVTVPRTAKQYSGWNWLLDGLTTIKRSVEAAERDQRLPAAQEGTRPSLVEVSQTKSFAEAVSGRWKPGPVKQPDPIGRQHQSPITKEFSNGVISLTIDPNFVIQRQQQLLKCVVVETTRKIWNTGDLQSWIKGQWKLAEIPGLHRMGERKWLVQLASDEENDRILTLSEEIKGDELRSIEAWTPENGKATKVMELEVRGIPAHLWCPKILHEITGTVGNLLDVDKENLSGERIDCLGATVEVEELAPKVRMLALNLGDQVYNIRVRLKNVKKERKGERRRKLKITETPQSSATKTAGKDAAGEDKDEAAPARQGRPEKQQRPEAAANDQWIQGGLIRRGVKKVSSQNSNKFESGMRISRSKFLGISANLGKGSKKLPESNQKAGQEGSGREGNTDSGTKSDSVSGPDPEANPDGQPGTKSMADPNLNLNADPDTDAEVDPGADAEVDPGADAEVDPGADAEVDPGADAEVNPDTDAEVDPNADAEVDSNAGAAVDPDMAPDAEPNVEPHANMTTNLEANRNGNTAADLNAEPDVDQDADQGLNSKESLGAGSGADVDADSVASQVQEKPGEDLEEEEGLILDRVANCQGQERRKRKGDRRSPTPNLGADARSKRESSPREKLCRGWIKTPAKIEQGGKERSQDGWKKRKITE